MAKSTTAPGRPPPLADVGLWREAMRDVAPLPRRGRLPASPARPTRPPSAEEARPRASSAAKARAPLDAFADLDRANAERLKRGLLPIDARLDLHGRTQTAAHRALADFVAAARADGRRCVLVITGRGLSPDGPGILKRSVPRWLEEPALRRHLLAIAPAQPRHGGAGALYLLLRKMR